LPSLQLVCDKSQAVLAGERALDIAWRLSDVDIEIPANTSLGQVLHDQGDYRRAAALFRRNIEVLVGELSHHSFRGGAPRSIHSRTCLVSSLAELGEFDEAARYAEEAFRAAHALEHPHSLVVASAGLGHVLLRRGDGPRAIEIVEPAVTIARAPEAALWFPRIASTLGAAYLLADRPGDAYFLLEEALARTIARELVHQRALITVWLGEAAMALGRVDEARQMAEQALRLSRDNDEWGHEAWSLCLLGDIASVSAPDDPESATRLYGEAQVLGGALNMKPVVARSLLGQGAERRTRSLRPGPGTTRRRDHHVPRDGHAVLDGESPGGAGSRLDASHGVSAMKRAVSMASPIGRGPPYFSGGVTPAGRGTCATFRVMDTRL
jgi:tetratricopeptide (TPR) repeat protein